MGVKTFCFSIQLIWLNYLLHFSRFRGFYCGFLWKCNRKCTSFTSVARYHCFELIVHQSFIWSKGPKIFQYTLLKPSTPALFFRSWKRPYIFRPLQGTVKWGGPTPKTPFAWDLLTNSICFRSKHTKFWKKKHKGKRSVGLRGNSFWFLEEVLRNVGSYLKKKIGNYEFGVPASVPPMLSFDRKLKVIEY